MRLRAGGGPGGGRDQLGVCLCEFCAMFVRFSCACACVISFVFVDPYSVQTCPKHLTAKVMRRERRLKIDQYSLPEEVLTMDRGSLSPRGKSYLFGGFPQWGRSPILWMDGRNPIALFEIIVAWICYRGIIISGLFGWCAFWIWFIRYLQNGRLSQTGVPLHQPQQGILQINMSFEGVLFGRPLLGFHANFCFPPNSESTTQRATTTALQQASCF